MFGLLEEAGFTRIRSAVVPRFRFRKAGTQNSAEAYGVKAVMMTALKPGGSVLLYLTNAIFFVAANKLLPFAAAASL